MIVVDASVLVAILLDEPEATTFARFVLGQPGTVMSPVGYWEAAIKLRTVKGDQGVAELDVAIRQLGLSVVDASTATARIAADAERDFGKRTPAKLNLGDCFAYALAKELNAPILFKGDDFTQTDVKSALPA